MENGIKLYNKMYINPEFETKNELITLKELTSNICIIGQVFIVERIEYVNEHQQADVNVVILILFAILCLLYALCHTNSK